MLSGLTFTYKTCQIVGQKGSHLLVYLLCIMHQRTQNTVWNYFNSFPVKSLQDPMNIRQGKGAFVLKRMLDDLVKNALCCYGCMEVWCGLSVLLL